MILLKTNNFLKVSCTVVNTTGRFHLLKKSVQCYLNQTYPNKELVIISQAEESDQIKEWIESLNRDDVLFFEAPPSISLGEMRNTSIEIARGDVICQWDDDDWYHSDRISYQYDLLLSTTSASACCYSTFLKYFKEEKVMYVCDWSGEGKFGKFLSGAVMFYKKYYHEYECRFYPEFGDQCHTEEDLNVLKKLIEKGDIIPALKPSHYVYIYHGLNTYDRFHHELALDVKDGRKSVMSKSELIRHKEILIESMKDMGVEDTISFCDLNDQAFTYEP